MCANSSRKYFFSALNRIFIKLFVFHVVRMVQSQCWHTHLLVQPKNTTIDDSIARASFTLHYTFKNDCSCVHVRSILLFQYGWFFLFIDKKTIIDKWKYNTFKLSVCEFFFRQGQFCEVINLVYYVYMSYFIGVFSFAHVSLCRMYFSLSLSIPLTLLLI